MCLSQTSALAFTITTKKIISRNNYMSYHLIWLSFTRKVNINSFNAAIFSIKIIYKRIEELIFNLATYQLMTTGVVDWYFITICLSHDGLGPSGWDAWICKRSSSSVLLSSNPIVFTVFICTSADFIRPLQLFLAYASLLKSGLGLLNIPRWPSLILNTEFF